MRPKHFFGFTFIMQESSTPNTRPSGAGKTQTALQLCLNLKDDYFVIGQLIASTTDSFIESLNTLAQQLCLKLTPKPGDSEDEYIDSIISSLVNYFNHENRSQRSYLMLIDDFHIKTDPAHNFVEQIFEDVKKLKFVITTIEHDLPGDFPGETLHVIEFNGMSESEYLSFFKKKGLCSKESDKDITKLVETIGSLPLTLISARKYLAKHNSRIEEYLRILEQLKTSTPEIHTQWEEKSAIPLLLLSLQQIIKFLKKHYKRIAEVIMCLPYLDYKAIRTDVIEACYRHFVSAENAKEAASAIVNYFLDYSLCHYVGQDKDKLSFHAETMTALKLFYKYENRKSDYERLWFLIEMFCFEIDLDVRVDISLNRNLLFLKHAGKVIKQLEQEDSEDGSDEKILKQRRIYMCYLHYVIGKTSLFQATDIPFAHKHLMRARILCTDLVEDKSDLTKKRCLYLKGKDDIPEMKVEKVLHAFALFCAAETGPGFAQTFVCGKFRNDRDVHILQSVSSTKKGVCKSGYLSIKDYKCLSKEKLAMPLDLLSKGFLGELMMHILFDNGRALDELMYVANEDDRQKVKIARNFEFQTCIEFTKKMSSREKFQNFPILCYLALDREEQAYTLERQNKGHSTESLINRIYHIRKIMEQGKNNHFQLGILKTEPNEREYHNCECYRLLLKYHQQLFKLSKFKETLSEGRKAEEEFEKILLKIEHDQKQYKWVEMPKFYIQCAKFLHLSKTVEDCNLSIDLYQKAIDFEENRSVHLSRYLWEGYFGKAKCCLLVRKHEAQKIYDELQKRLEGTDHNLRIQKLNKLFSKN